MFFFFKQKTAYEMRISDWVQTCALPSWEYERGVVFTLGRFTGVKGPGLILLIPLIQQMVRTDLRTLVLDVPTQDVISHDNVSVQVNAVIYFRVIDPEKAIIQVEDFMQATSQLAQTTLRSEIGRAHV